MGKQYRPNSNTEIIENIHRNIAFRINATPLPHSRYFSHIAGCHIWIKCENLQLTHAFKMGGVLNKMRSIGEKIGSLEKVTFVTASGGNHSLSVTIGARICGAGVTVFLPLRTPDLKISRIKSSGAEVRLYGDYCWDAANEKAMTIAAKNGYTYIPFDDDVVINGQAV